MANASTVLLTGGSGFLGGHTVAALLAAGHRVRMLVRDPARAGRTLAALGIDLPGDAGVEVRTGDMTDASAVADAARGCSATVHAAATYSFRRRDAATMRRDNVAGATTVLEAALAAGCDPVVHVSSTTALTRPGGATLIEGSPLGPGHGPYSTSKVAAEQVARSLQAAGAPVVIVNPGVIVGPHDPSLGESNRIVTDVLRDRMPVWPRGTVQFVDVRDTAAVLVACLAPGLGPRTYLVPGHPVAVPHEPLREVTGRRLPCRVLPARLAAASVVPGYLTGWDVLPGAVEGARLIGCANTVDASATAAQLGVTARTQAESFADTVTWLVEAGHVGAAKAGRLGGPTTAD